MEKEKFCFFCWDDSLSFAGCSLFFPLSEKSSVFILQRTNTRSNTRNRLPAPYVPCQPVNFPYSYNVDTRGQVRGRFQKNLFFSSSSFMDLADYIVHILRTAVWLSVQTHSSLIHIFSRSDRKKREID